MADRLRIRRVPMRTLSSMSTSLPESSTVVWVGGRFRAARTTDAGFRRQLAIVGAAGLRCLSQAFRPAQWRFVVG
jgi:hypothetical protein